MNEANLILLGQYHYQHVTDAEFDMRHYRQQGDFVVNFWGASNCGTVGCALGHAPLVPGLKVEPKDFSGAGCLDFDKYCERVFGFSAYNEPKWHWLFSDVWADRDNTRHGFIRRLIHLLRGGSLDDEFVEGISASGIMEL